VWQSDLSAAASAFNPGSQHTSASDRFADGVDIHVRIVKVHLWPTNSSCAVGAAVAVEAISWASVGTVLVPVTLAIEQRLYCWEGAVVDVVYLPLSVDLRQLTRPLGRGYASCYGYHASIPITLGGGYFDLRLICQAGCVAIGVRPLGMLIGGGDAPGMVVIKRSREPRPVMLGGSRLRQTWNDA
jgi:hypothetical protein